MHMGIEQAWTKIASFTIDDRGIAWKGVRSRDGNRLNFAVTSDDSGTYQELPRLYIDNIAVDETVALGFRTGPRLDVRAGHLVKAGHDKTAN
jgi:hypothetical protein